MILLISVISVIADLDPQLIQCVSRKHGVVELPRVPNHFQLALSCREPELRATQGPCEMTVASFQHIAQQGRTGSQRYAGIDDANKNSSVPRRGFGTCSCCDVQPGRNVRKCSFAKLNIITVFDHRQGHGYHILAA